jgi:hypothetical protein
MAWRFRTSGIFPEISDTVQKRPVHFSLFSNQHLLDGSVEDAVNNESLFQE